MNQHKVIPIISSAGFTKVCDEIREIVLRNPNSVIEAELQNTDAPRPTLTVKCGKNKISVRFEIDGLHQGLMSKIESEFEITN